MPASRDDDDTTRRGAAGTDQSMADREIPISLQQQFWNSWNGIFVGHDRGPISQRQSQIVCAWLQSIGKTNLDILDLGCGTGWMVRRMLQFGRVTGIDLSDAVLSMAQQECPDARFLAGEFMTMDLEPASFDVVVTLEVLAHVADQAGFIRRIASLLRPGGQLMLATQNRPVLARSEDVAPVAEGQIRNWVDRRDLRKLLEAHLRVEDMLSICPHGHLGFLRIVNSVKLNRAASFFVPREKIDALKERMWLGHTLMTRAQSARKTSNP